MLQSHHHHPDRLSGATRVIIAAFPVLALLGPRFLPISLGGVNLYGFRILVLAVFAVGPLLRKTNIEWIRYAPGRRYAVMAVIWIIWGTASLLWTPDIVAGLEEEAGIIVGLVTGIGLLNLGAFRSDGVRALGLGWLASYACNAAVTVFELATGKHLPSAYTTYAQTAGVSQYTVWGTFWNPNNYGAYLVIALPILVWMARSSSGRWQRIVATLEMATVPVFLLLSTSRLAFFCFCGELIFMSLYLPKNRRYWATMLLILATSSVALLWAVRTDNEMFRKVLVALGPGRTTDPSIAIRINLTINGLHFIARSFGMGIGAGAFEHEIHIGHTVAPTSSLANPHNLWVEIGSQYGIIVLASVIFWLVTVWRSTRPGGRVHMGNAASLLSNTTSLSLFAFVAIAVVPSSYLLDPICWMTMSTLLIMATSASRARRNASQASVNAGPSTDVPQLAR